MISVVIPTYNRPSLIQSCLAHLAKQTYSREHFEIIVVNDGGKDTIEEIVQSENCGITIRYAKLANRSGPGAARNRGARLATGEIIVFLDDDCVIEPDWLESYSDAHARHPNAGAICGSVRARPGGTLAGRLQFQAHITIFTERNETLGTDYYTEGPVLFCFGTNRSYKRHVFEATGYFDERLKSYEDVDYDWRMYKTGIQILYCPRISVSHEYNISGASRVAQAYSVGKYGHLFMVKNPDYPLPDRSAKDRLWRLASSHKRYRNILSAAHLDELVIYYVLGLPAAFAFMLGRIHGRTIARDWHREAADHQRVSPIATSRRV